MKKTSPTPYKEKKHEKRKTTAQYLINNPKTKYWQTKV